MSTPPAVFLSGSAVGIYGDRPGEILDEDFATGEGFFPELVARLGGARRSLAPKATRVVNLRTAVVVARRRRDRSGARAHRRWDSASRFGRGGQYWPWISLHDEVSAIRAPAVLEAQRSGEPGGADPGHERRVTEASRAGCTGRTCCGCPTFAVKLLGEAGVAAAAGRRAVVPDAAEADGFDWRAPSIEQRSTRRSRAKRASRLIACRIAQRARRRSPLAS